MSEPTPEDHILPFVLALKDTLTTYTSTQEPSTRDLIVGSAEFCALVIAIVGFKSDATPEQLADGLDETLASLKASAFEKFLLLREGKTPLISVGA